jgi:hypothetical protein
MNSPAFYPKLISQLKALSQDFSQLSPERKERLLQISRFIQERRAAGQSAELVFICTHNSRRSHFGQIWARIWADYYGMEGVQSYSGGTEATTFHPHAIEALRSLGFEISSQDTGKNPRYAIRYAETVAPIHAWSKVYADATNPQEGFCAIMTCSEADEACPAVFGAAARVSLPFEDPKVSDGTPVQAQTYRARCLQIAKELAFVFASA